MSSFTSDHSASKKRAAHKQDDTEAPRVKIPRSAFSSFRSASLPSSPPLLALSLSLPEMHSHQEHHDSGLRLPFSLSNLAPENGLKKRSRMFNDVGDIDFVASMNKPSNKPRSFGLTPSTSSPDFEETAAPVQTEFEGPINLMDARTGRIASTRDPRGGFGYDPDLNFTPENSFDLVQTTASISRNALDPDKPPIYAVSMFGPPQNNLAQQGEDDDSKTVVSSPQEVVDAKKLPSSGQSSFSVSEIVEPNSSFDDVLVCRANGDSSYKSPSTKPCSAAANMEDIHEAEYSAGELLKLRPDSESICDIMVSRLERMINAKIASAKQEAKVSRTTAVVPRPVDAANQLLKYLIEQKETRLEMGEDKGTVDLENAWAGWLVKVTQSGVMHLKQPGCKCRPELMAAEPEKGNWS